MRPLPSDTSMLLQRFSSHLLLERGVAANTAEAYMRDVEKLVAWLADTPLTLDEVALTDLQYFAAAMSDLGISPRSLARIISGVKNFFHWLRAEDYHGCRPHPAARVAAHRASPARDSLA